MIVAAVVMIPVAVSLKEPQCWLIHTKREREVFTLQYKEQYREWEKFVKTCCTVPGSDHPVSGGQFFQYHAKIIGWHPP